MKSQDKNSDKKYLQLNYYGGITSLGALPRDINWLKEILRFLGIVKADPLDEPNDDNPTPNY